MNESDSSIEPLTSYHAPGDDIANAWELLQRQEQSTFDNKWKESLAQLEPNYIRGILDEHIIHRNAFFKWFTGGRVKYSIVLT